MLEPGEGGGGGRGGMGVVVVVAVQVGQLQVVVDGLGKDGGLLLGVLDRKNEEFLFQSILPTLGKETFCLLSGGQRLFGPVQQNRG